jgi:sigma-B regulation protein RsbU (phosphoserine phosphatase)
MLARLPITISSPLLFGLPVLAVALLLSVLWNRQSQQAVIDLADQNIEQIHALAAAKVADVLSIPVRICEVNAHLVHSGALDPDDLRAWRRTLVNEARAFDMLSAISWGGADGRSAWVSRYADGSFYWALKDDPSAATMDEWRLDAAGDVSDAPTSTFEFNLFSRPWFRTPRDTARATWSEPYVWVGGEDSAGVTLGLSYGIPLRDPKGAFLGVIDADYSLNDLSSFLHSVEIGKTGVAVLATPDALLLAASNDTPVVTPDGRRVNAHQSPDPLIATAAGFIGTAEEVRNTHAELEIGGEVYYLRASPIGRELGLDWTLTTMVPEKDFLAEIESQFRRSTIMSLAAVALTVLVGLAAARWLVAPLVTLVTAVRRIGQGDLKVRVNIQHAPEYTKLADEINEMTVGLQDRMRMRESLSLAMEVQRNLLPSGDPEINGLDIAGHSTYCDETGGDYYDFLEVTGTDEDTIVVAVGDVMGHGVAAAMLMATARGILRSRCAVPGSLADFLGHLNTMLVPDTGGYRFMTMLLATIDARRQELRWASAGHGPPIVYDARSDRFPDIDGGDIPLGIYAEVAYEEYTRSEVSSGYIIVAATDGIWETKGQDGTLYGMDRLRALLRRNAHRSAAEISEEIRNTLARFRGPGGLDDDVTLVIVKVL